MPKNILNTSTECQRRATPLARAQRLAERVRRLAAKGDRAEAERCRRLAFAAIQYHALTADDAPAPNQWMLERLLAAHIAADAKPAAA